MSQTLFAALQQLLGAQHVQSSEEASPYLTDTQGRYVGQVIAAVPPANTEEVAAVVRACVAMDAPIVVQGGNTGLMGGATPDASGKAVLVLLDRLNKVRAVDTDNDTLTVEAGCILQNIQDVARDADRLFPLSLGAEGSCTLGGNLGTNAGGTAVLRYGNTRELTLGLEVVTAQGEIWNGLRATAPRPTLRSRPRLSRSSRSLPSPCRGCAACWTPTCWRPITVTRPPAASMKCCSAIRGFWR